MYIFVDEYNSVLVSSYEILVEDCHGKEIGSGRALEAGTNLH